MLKISQLFGVGQHPLIGLDIGSSSIKMVELTSLGKNQDIRVNRYFVEPLPENTVQGDGSIISREALVSAISKCWAGLGSSTKNVAIALPGSAVISKRVLAPIGLSDRDLALHIEAESAGIIPFSLDEVYMDWVLLGQSEGSAEDLEVQVTAAKKEKMQERTSCVEEAGLKVVVVDIDNFATQRAMARVFESISELRNDDVVVHIDIGASNTQIVIYKAGKVIYMREQAFGGNNLTQDIAREFGMSFSDAEAAKLSNNLPDSYKNSVLQPFLNTMAQEVYRAMQFFYTSTQYSACNHIVLSGGCSTLPEALETVADRMQVPVTVANPFAQMSLVDSDISRGLIRDASKLIIPCGLALRRFDKL